MLQAKSTKILHQLQSLLVRVLRLTTKIPSSLHQVFIYKTAILLQLCQFSDTIQSKLAHKSSYIISIKAMKIKFPKLYDNNKKVKKPRLEGLLEGQKDIKEVLHCQNLPYISKVICFELISKYYNDCLVSYFGIKNIQKLIARKYN